MSRFGDVDIAAHHPFSRSVLHSFTSPYLQDLLVFTGVVDVFSAVPAQIERLLGISVSTSTVYRVTMAVAEALSSDELLEPIDCQPSYLQIDGSMILTDDGWQEVKVGRVYPRDACSGQADLAASRYCAHLGGHTEFMQQISQLVPAACPLVILSDGARWIENEVNAHYPQAVKILDFYHAVEHLAQAVTGLILPKNWLRDQRARLLASDSQLVVAAVEALPGVDEQRARNLRNYYTHNQKRMDYAAFQSCGYDIGSGAIEAAHRTLVQVRMKRSGQRWNPTKAPQMLKLRVAYKSRQWKCVENVIQKG